MYKKLKTLFRSLYELEVELAMFNDDEDMIDANTSEYLEQLKSRIQNCEDNIKKLLNHVND